MPSNSIRALVTTILVTASCFSGAAESVVAKNTGENDMSAHSILSYEVLVTDGVTRGSDKRLPNGDRIVSSPITSTLIYGKTDAVLIDPPMSREQTQKVSDWVAQSGKHLKYIYVTHGHGDHWFGTEQILERFPGATVYATEGTIRLMHQQATVGREKVYDKDFPGLIGKTDVIAQAIPAEGFTLEGHTLQAIDVGHTDTDDTTVLLVPSMGLVVAGDVAYNGVHQYLLEGGNGGLQAWVKAIDQVEALKPRIVIAGHKQKNRADDPVILEQTRHYLLDAIALLAEKPTPLEFFDKMIELHPDRINQGPLWYSAIGLLGAPTASSGNAPQTKK